MDDALPVAVLEGARSTPAVISQRPLGSSRPCSDCSTSRSVRPSTYSMTMYGSADAVDVVLAGVVDATIAGWFSDAADCASRRNRAWKRVAGQVGAQHLDRDVAAEPHVVAEVDLGHAAAAEQLAELVAAAEPPAAQSSSVVPSLTAALTPVAAGAAARATFDHGQGDVRAGRQLAGRHD